MKKMAVSFIKFTGLLFISLLLFSIRAAAQDVLKTNTSLPEDVNKIVTASCTPCHTNQGGLMSRTKLNFTEWTNYSPEKQKEKAAKMYSEVNKGAMPPKAAREKRPETIPSIEQIEIIKKWSESFPPETK
jgi:hypothetical protein